ncbi:MAG: dephospho-CoA kinase [Erysipelotrichaceae bacterium]|nr:dephospho-CoA kinase [Erysipelotrichaceae bacterium]MDO5121620.1 dephospho-CoA kinase [Erysipelotrichaceae bacterium]
MKKIGITGTIGSGKTTLSILLRRRHLPVFDADGYTRICYHRSHPAAERMITEFGEGILDEYGEISRKALADIIFRDEEKRLLLNSIIHPFVLEGLNRFFENHSSEELVFAEIPLLYEVGWDKYFDICCVVSCDDEIAVQRLIEDRGMSEEDARLRIASQLDRIEKIERADEVIYNNGTIKDLDHCVAIWVRELKKR